MIPLPKGFRYASAAAGFKYQDRPDLGVVVSDVPAAAAGVFTTNRFQASPVLYCVERLSASPTARGVVVNAGQANACTGEPGYVDCQVAVEQTAEALGLSSEDLLPASTGVIGQPLRLNAWRAALPALKESFDTQSESGPMDFARAIMTTDTFPKVAWGSVRLGEQEARLVGMAKGSGMICPNMATLLGFIFTDAQVEPKLWYSILKAAVDTSFNRITVDGDTSTNDCVLGLANGASGLSVEGLGQQALQDAVDDLCQALSYMVVQDAEGGTKVVRIRVVGAVDDAQAEAAARTVGHSPLVKTALYGQDANWGRIVAALGRSGAEFNPEQVKVAMGSVPLFENGRPVSSDVATLDALMAPQMAKQDISIVVRLGQGEGEYTLLTCDLSHEYVSINADYRT